MWAHVQGLMICEFRDAVVYTLGVTRGYLSYCCLPISS